MLLASVLVVDHTAPLVRPGVEYLERQTNMGATR